MARATTKADLIASANGQFDKMWKLINGMDEGTTRSNICRGNGDNGQGSALEQG